MWWFKLKIGFSGHSRLTLAGSLTIKCTREPSYLESEGAGTNLNVHTRYANAYNLSSSPPLVCVARDPSQIEIDRDVCHIVLYVWRLVSCHWKYFFLLVSLTSIGLGWKTAHSHTSSCYMYFYLNLSTTVLQIKTTKQVFYSGIFL